MSNDELLAEMRAILARGNDGNDSPGELNILADRVDQLDKALSSGGDLPRAWNPTARKADKSKPTRS